MKKIQTWDQIIVTAGKFKWTTSSVLEIVQKKDARRGDWLVVKGVNIVKKGKKGEGFQEFEAPIHCSNVMLLDEKSGTWSRVWIRENKKGKKERFYKKSGNAVA